MSIRPYVWLCLFCVFDHFWTDERTGMVTYRVACTRLMAIVLVALRITSVKRSNLMRSPQHIQRLRQVSSVSPDFAPSRVLRYTVSPLSPLFWSAEDTLKDSSMKTEMNLAGKANELMKLGNRWQKQPREGEKGKSWLGVWRNPHFRKSYSDEIKLPLESV